ncbi:hypothetical protein OG948_54445 (plasmid) [Embleya sp. NBC_00888]|uniref:hypothetical protein n=1 Tax=Embleya sp. NBC_00888 TaxID=2975960 RepID=UPI00386F4EA4|nr:hypothetical protein OG948_54445 [Embleya sp. NBC_00888]
MPVDQGVTERAVTAVLARGERVDHQRGDLVARPSGKVGDQVVCGHRVLAMGVQEHRMDQTRRTRVAAPRVLMGRREFRLQRLIGEVVRGRQDQQRSRHPQTRLLDDPRLEQ